MSPSFSEQVLNHTHDIAFAIFRVARAIKNFKLKTSLEDAAVELVSDLKKGTVDKLLILVRLAASVNELKPVNAEVLERELKKLNEEIYRSMIGSREDIDLAKFFAQIQESTISGNPSGNVSGNESGNHPAIEKASKIDDSITDRQAAIVEFICRFPDDCRMKDIVAAFPEVSERTLRNDIQGLISEGVVERIGNSGPYTSFKLVPQTTNR